MARDKFIQQNENCRRIDDDFADNVLELLLDSQKKDPLPEIRFLNFYKEVPIFSPAYIVYAFDETLSCRTADVQCRAIAVAGSTIIQSAALRHDVLAKAVYQPETSEVIISELCYVQLYSDQRASVRVKMDSLFQIMIEAGSGQFNGKLRELSLNGCAVDIADPQLLGNYKFFYLNLDMPFKTFRGTNKSRIMVRLVRGEEIARGYRCIFTFEHDNTTEDQIGRLLTQRQTEIIRELK
jgi:hypothetical protein